MGKLLLPVLGAGGVGTAAVGGYILFKDNFSSAPSPEKTFRSQYPNAILKGDSNLWDDKFKTLKDGEQPAHSTLVQAKSKAESSEEEAKDLHKRGCKEIYDSKLGGTAYLSDFQSYCSKNLKDAITTPKTWISDENTQSGKWDNKLTSLSTHASQNGALDEKLNALKTTLSKISTKAWTNEHRKNLKDWCDASQKSIFLGEQDPRFIHVGIYCVEG
ncbi:hypothetical protein HF1_08430 [Mycoplasma haemofelis str. Langford 1]|uniref:Uncharacterized protein n=1 Tax=Mycoplasma haemofelis (strain Langford 1) TaxID=941640 RepID=E8ZI80_MYCHL|nr:hypothetical protein [Mycoplasma haemofelis]CBY92851.1 hypothetical protein HF1_08430 [Mycoplasma haemofelis str. Langford 1]